MSSQDKIKKELEKLPDEYLKELHEFVRNLLKKRSKKLDRSFSFKKAREATKRFKGSLSDTLIKERREK